MTFRSHIGVVTCVAAKLRDYFPTVAEPDFVPTELPFTPDDQILVEELRRHGHHVSAVIWGGDVSALVGTVDRLLIRSPWDYMDSAALRQRFIEWIAELDRAGLSVENHPRFMAWLTDKRYLKDLEAVGVPIVATRIVAPGEAVRLAEVFTANGPLIVKPSVSAAGAGLVYLTSGAAAEAFQAEFEVCSKQQWYLLQPFVAQIQTAGEWSLCLPGWEIQPRGPQTSRRRENPSPRRAGRLAPVHPSAYLCPGGRRSRHGPSC